MKIASSCPLLSSKVEGISGGSLGLGFPGTTPEAAFPSVLPVRSHTQSAHCVPGSSCATSRLVLMKNLYMGSLISSSQLGSLRLRWSGDAQGQWSNSYQLNSKAPDFSIILH